MLDLSLIDAGVLLFVAFSVLRGRSRRLGDSLHALIALLLIIGLFLGLRMNREIRDMLGGVAESLNAVPGLGSKLLVVIGAWYLMHLLRQQSGNLIGRAIPTGWHSRIRPLVDGTRAALLAGFLIWLVEGWIDAPPQNLPVAVQAVRAGDNWIRQQLQPEPKRAAGPIPSPAYEHAR
jgi:hypothetical protein